MSRRVFSGELKSPPRNISERHSKKADALGFGGDGVSMEVVDGGNEGGDVDTRSKNYLSGVISGAGKVESEAIFNVDSKLVKDQITQLVMCYVRWLYSISRNNLSEGYLKNDSLRSCFS